MKAKVGDKVRITACTGCHLFDIGDVVLIVERSDDVGDYKAETIDGSDDWFIKDMDEHMSNGEYVRAVKWTQVLEMVEGLEDE